MRCALRPTREQGNEGALALYRALGYESAGLEPATAAALALRLGARRHMLRKCLRVAPWAKRARARADARDLL